MSGMKQARDRLQDAWARLQGQWSGTCDRWHDVIRQRFEHDFLSEYERIVPSGLNALDHLSDLIEQARREVQ